MQTVNVPGVGPLNFPDGMSQDDMSRAIQANYPQIMHPSAAHPDDSDFVSGIKNLGNETVRVGAKAITGLPLMAGDFASGLGNLASRVTGIGQQSPSLSDLVAGKTGKKDPFPYPSDMYEQHLDAAFAPPTSRAGKASEALSTLIASLAVPGPTAPKTATQALTGADAVKAAAMGEARKAGVVIPPSLTKNPPVGANLANGYGGTAETLKAARDLNTPNINGLIATDIGLDHGSSLTTPAIRGQITDAVKAGYDPIRKLTDVPVDAAHRQFVQSIAGADRGAANISPSLGNPQISELSSALMPPPTAVNSLTNAQKVPSFAGGDLVDAISALRAKAADARASGNVTVAKAYKSAANGFESLIDRYLQGKGEDSKGMLNDFRTARTRIAKGHDAMEALNPSTGDIDPRVLSSLDEGQMTGGSRAAATIARAFPEAVAPSKGTPPGVTAFQGNMAPEALADGTGGVLSTLGGILGRNAARRYALSDKAQAALMQPKGKTLTKKALDSVFANPAAFGTLYEDARD